MNKSIIWSFVIIIILAATGFLLLKSIKSGTEDSSSDTSIPATAPSAVAGKCYIGGCSSQICSDEPGAISTCEYKEEYACYKAAKCERQASGECGWTETPEFSICMEAVVPTGADIK